MYSAHCVKGTMLHVCLYLTPLQLFSTIAEPQLQSTYAMAGASWPARLWSCIYVAPMYVICCIVSAVIFESVAEVAYRHAVKEKKRNKMAKKKV